MKKIKYIKLLSLALALTFASCEKWIDPDINVDPNNPDDVTMDLLLPSVQGFWSYQLGGDISLAPRLWMQQLSGVTNQGLQYDRYNVNSSDIDNIWRFGSYVASIEDTKKIIDKATEENAPAYLGIAEVMWVYQFSVLTDLWGDIPYTEALQGLDNDKPKFDSQLSIFQDLDAKITDAISNLAKDPGLFDPSAVDLIYGGDLSLWTKAAYAARARLYLKWGQKDASKLALIQDAIDNSFESSDDDMIFWFKTAKNNSNPLYQFDVIDRPGYIAMGEYYINIMDGGTPTDFSDDDPRLALVADTINGGYFGSPAGDPSSGSDLGTYLVAPSAGVVYSTYAEMKFIEAEINVGTTAGDAALQDAIRASLAHYGVLGDNPSWEASHINNISNATLEDIIDAKYVGIAFQLEVYNDYRRTGFPKLTTYQGQTIPPRYPYASSSYDYNEANVPLTSNASKTTPVWWNSK